MVLLQIVEASNRGGPNPQLKDKIRVVKGKIEDYSGPKVDTLISEPIGVLLVHERMVSPASLSLFCPLTRRLGLGGDC